MYRTITDLLTDDRDVVLLRDLSRGDSATFWKLWEEHERYVYGICLRTTRGRADEARELLSEVMLRAFDKLPLHAHTIYNLKGWLAALTRNLHADLKRKSSRECPIETNGKYLHRTEVEESTAPTPEDITASVEAGERLMRSANSLSSKLKDVFILRLAGQMTYAEIAPICGITSVTARKRMQRARALLGSRPGSPTILHDGALFPRLLDIAAAGAATMTGKITKPDSSERSLVTVTLAHITRIEIEAALILPRPVVSSSREGSLKSYISRHPKGWKKRLDLARLLSVRGLAPAAIAEYNLALQRKPQFVGTWIEMARLLLETGYRAEAVEAYHQALINCEGEAGRAALRGLIEFASERHEEALQRFRECEGRPSAHLYLSHEVAMALTDLGEVNAALTVLDRCLETDPADSVALALSYRPLRELGRLKEALRRAALASEIDPRSPLALKAIIDGRCATGLVRGEEGKETRRLLRALESASGDNSDTYDSLARYHTSRGNWEKGLSILATFTLRRARNPEGWYRCACWLYRGSRVEAAVRAISEALSLQKNARIIGMACEIFFSAGLIDRARAMLDELLRLRPGSWKVLARSAIVAARFAGAREIAGQLSVSALRMRPDNPLVKQARAQVLAELGGTEEAIVLLRSAMTDLPDDSISLGSMNAALALAEQLARSGELAESRKWSGVVQSGAIELSVFEPALGNFLLGRALAMEGQPREALMRYREALKFQLYFPLSGQAKSAIAALRRNSGSARG